MSVADALLPGASSRDMMRPNALSRPLMVHTPVRAVRGSIQVCMLLRDLERHTWVVMAVHSIQGSPCMIKPYTTTSTWEGRGGQLLV
jgi:hypothetical protein